MKIERTLSIMLFLCALDISVKAQSPTQNYVLSKDVLDVDGTHAITTVTYYDGLNRLEESTYAEGTEKQDKVFATWDKVYMKENM